jgi:hypothetical protein
MLTLRSPGRVRGALTKLAGAIAVNGWAIYWAEYPRMRSARESYVLILRPLPGVNGVRALRGTLKALIRYRRLRAVSVSRLGADDTEPKHWGNTPAHPARPVQPISGHRRGACRVRSQASACHPG